MLEVSRIPYIPLNKRHKNTIETGFIDYDMHVFDLKLGEITILFGRNGEGKSTVASQILAHHLNCNKSAYLYSGELSENKIQEWLYRQIVGANAKYYDLVNTKYGQKIDIKEDVVDAIKKWHEDRLFIYNMKIDRITKDANLLFTDMNNALVCGVNLFMIDNVMTAFEINERTQYSDQANFIQRCKDFARDKNVHLVIICHPNKIEGELTAKSTKGNLTKNDISGSGNIGNKADNIIAVERVWKDKTDDQGLPDAFITSLKDREEGKRAMFEYWFSNKSLRFYNNNTPKNVVYDWQQYLPGYEKVTQQGFEPLDDSEPIPF